MISILGRCLALLQCSSSNLATHYRQLTTSQGTIYGAAVVLSTPKIENRRTEAYDHRPQVEFGLYQCVHYERLTQRTRDRQLFKHT